MGFFAECRTGESVMDANDVGFLELLNSQRQYVVPRWQRRYRWGKDQIERLIEDLVAVAEAADDKVHYGGTLLTFQERGSAGIVTIYRVVDGQQRLTTISILLACIAEKMGDDGKYKEWTSKFIREDRLTNPGKPSNRLRKLRLQDGDEEEYRNIIEGNANGPGAVTQAYKIMRRLVAKYDVATLFRGLERFQVVSIGLDKNEDPQQIFESLNATGLELTESEKVKNWLLIGMEEEEQENLYKTCWLEIEKALDAKETTDNVDTFLRDLVRWRTGEPLRYA